MRILGVAALGTEPSAELAAKARVFVGELSSLCGRGLCLALGGYWGLMKVVVDEALRHGLCVVLFPPLEKEDFDYPEEAIVVRAGVSYRLRSILLCRTSDVLVCLGGEAGTMQEVFSAYLEGVPVIMLGDTRQSSDVLERLAPCLDSRCTTEVTVVKDPRELARKACETLGRSPRVRLRGTG